jgi:hypothetical protein
VPRLQIRERDDKNASGKACIRFIDTNFRQSDLLGPHSSGTTVLQSWVIGEGIDKNKYLAALPSVGKSRLRASMTALKHRVAENPL